MLILLVVLNFDILLRALEQCDAFIKRDFFRSGAVSHIEFVLLLQLLFELEDIARSYFGKTFLEFIHFEVLLLGEISESSPVFSDHVDLVLVLLLNFVFVHLEDTELLDNLIDVELHIHGLHTNRVDHVKQVLDCVDSLDVTLELGLVSLCLLNDFLQVTDGKVQKNFAKGIKPFLNLFVRLLDNFAVIDKDEEVLNLHLL